MTIRSRIWDSGRKDKAVSFSVNSMREAAVLILLIRLSWVRMTPFGTPVVPEV